MTYISNIRYLSRLLFCAAFITCLLMQTVIVVRLNSDFYLYLFGFLCARLFQLIAAAWIVSIFVKGGVVFDFPYLYRLIRNCFKIFAVFYLFVCLKNSIAPTVTQNFDHFFYNFDAIIGVTDKTIIGADAFLARYLDFGMIVDKLYMAYFDVKFLVLVFVLAEPYGKKYTSAFLDCFLSLWLIGILLHYLLPAMGPFAFEKFGGLSSLPLANANQLRCLENYRQTINSGSTLLVSYAIAAFPSLHVAVATFVWLSIGSRLNRIGGFLLLAFAVSTFFGSVALKWHYLVDGLAGFTLAYLLNCALLITTTTAATSGACPKTGTDGT